MKRSQLRKNLIKSPQLPSLTLIPDLSSGIRALVSLRRLRLLVHRVQVFI